MNAILRTAAAALIVFTAAAAQAAPAALEAIDAARADSPAVAQVFASPADLAARLDRAERRVAGERAAGPEAIIARAELESAALRRVLRPAPSRLDSLVAHAAR
jgi:uncharacterized protein (DUF2141 family)